ncbi:pseudouridine synthase [Lentinus brumalis]|uniref:21S rRNA pseudouridine(2819) synthase n=1 Tax=Lentinus brumalis TaxID=2498619 RepID=A0A371D941_9APHY|nr:pseudouridine synthase [Polyporus brumalis]
MSSYSKSASRLPRVARKPKQTIPYEVRGQGRGPVYSISPQKSLLYADRGLLVVNKPNGMIAQLGDPGHVNSEPNVDTTLFKTFTEDLREYLGLKEPLRTLHRLDKPTTGALALACTKESAKHFSRQISTGEVQKTYLALVCGDASAFKQRHGYIETKLECRDGWVRIPDVTGVYERDRRELPTTRLRGENWTKDAVSEYEVVASSSKAPLSLLRLHLHTGLKHQLRVHLAQHLLTPILGDGLYVDPKSRVLRDIKNKIAVPWGLFLHSSRFSLHRYNPSKFRLTVGAPLPSAFVDLCGKASIPLGRDDILGGVWADDKKVRGSEIVLPEEGETIEDAVQKLGGRWFGTSPQREEEQRQSY